MRAERAAVDESPATIGLLGMALMAFVMIEASALHLAAGVAHAQASDAPSSEVPIGTFNLGQPQHGVSVVEPPAGMSSGHDGDAGEGGNRWFFESWYKSPPPDAAEPLYGKAMRALEAGRMDEAQRLFERLIAEAPLSAQAAEARRHLGRIYSGAAAADARDAGAPHAQTETHAAAETGATGKPAAPLAVEHAAPPALPAVDVDQPLSRPVLAQTRVASDVDGQFLAAAGDRVFFGAGSTSLGTRAQSVIQAQARFLKQNPWLSAAIEGHADDGPVSDAETLRLSDTRAAVVRDRLIAEGISGERLTAYGRGREERVSDCPESACQAQNRRAITILLRSRISAEMRGRGSAAAGAPTTESQ